MSLLKKLPSLPYYIRIFLLFLLVLLSFWFFCIWSVCNFLLYREWVMDQTLFLQITTQLSPTSFNESIIHVVFTYLRCTFIVCLMSNDILFFICFLLCSLYISISIHILAPCCFNYLHYIMCLNIHFQSSCFPVQQIHVGTPILFKCLNIIHHHHSISTRFRDA